MNPDTCYFRSQSFHDYENKSHVNYTILQIKVTKNPQISMNFNIIKYVVSICNNKNIVLTIEVFILKIVIWVLKELDISILELEQPLSQTDTNVSRFSRLVIFNINLHRCYIQHI